MTEQPRAEGVGKPFDYDTAEEAAFDRAMARLRAAGLFPKVQPMPSPPPEATPAPPRREPRNQA